MKTEAEFSIQSSSSRLVLEDFSFSLSLSLVAIFKINGSYIPRHNSGPADARVFSAEKLGTFKDECWFRATTSAPFARHFPSLCSWSRRRLPTTFLPRPVNVPVVLAKSQLVERKGERASCNLMYGLLGQLSLLVAKMSLTPRYYYAR